MRLGVIGLGNMGGPIALNLIRAGHQLTVHDIDPQKAARHRDLGAGWAATPAELATASELVFTSLPGPPEADAVTLGPQGIAAGARPGLVHVDLTTNSPAMLNTMQAALAQRGATLLDAPVSGGPRGATSGKLAIWVGGDTATFETCRPILEAIGDQVRHMGPLGHGTIVKLVHNCSIYAVGLAVAEAFTMGVKAGMDPLVLFSALRQGAVGRRRTLDGLIDQFLPGEFEPASFALRLAHKDVALARELGQSLGVAMPVSAQVIADLQDSLARGWADRDSRAALLIPAQRAGVTIAVDRAALRQALADDPTVATEPAR